MMISLGHKCSVAIALRKINTIQPSLPFDYIGNYHQHSLWNVYNILSQLKQNTLDIEKFVTVDENRFNENRFHFSHFYKKGYKHIKLRTDSPEEIDETVLELFTKRFVRLQSKIFYRPNLLIYNYHKNQKENTEEIIEAGNKIIEMNPLNYLLVLQSGKSRQINTSIEYIKGKRSSSIAIKANLSHYLSKKPEEWIKHYLS